MATHHLSVIHLGSIFLVPGVLVHLVSTHCQIPHLQWNFLTLTATYFLCMLLYFNAIILYTDLKLRWMAKRAGAEPIPRVRGKWLFNIDVMLSLAKRFHHEPPGKLFGELSEKYGQTYDFFFCAHHGIYTTEPEIVKHILTGQSFLNYPKGENFQAMFSDFLGSGIFNSDSENWKFHRSLTKPFFSKEEISDFETFEKHTAVLLKMIHTLSSNKLITISSNHGAVDIQDLFGRFTMDTATDFLFGACVESMSELEINPSVGNFPKASSFLGAFNELQENCHDRFNRGPVWSYYELFSSRNTEPMKVVAPLIDSIIAKAMENNVSATEKSSSLVDPSSVTLLSHLISVTRDQKVIRDELLNILLASRDTTASLLTSVVYELAKNPCLLKKLREEITSTCGKDGAVNAATVRGMKYLRAVLNETLRVHAPVPFDTRSSDKEDVIIVKGKPLYIPPKCGIGYGLLPMQMRTDLWGADAGVFDPDRWLDSRLQKMTSNPFIFTPFSAGPRICLGQQYAYNEASLCLVRLLQTYSKIEFAPECQPEGSYYTCEDGKTELLRFAAITLTFKKGLWVRLSSDKE